MISLYPYQLTFIHGLLSAFQYGKHILGEAPCGFGKSYCIAEIARRAIEKNKKVLILSHRLILLRQNNGALHDFGHNLITINDHGKSMPLDHNLYCSTVQTIQSRIKQPEFLAWIGTFDLVLVDESHLQYSNFLFETGILDNIFVVGFTGSPRRDGNQRQLGMDYDKIVKSISVKELIALGRLVPCRYYEVPCSLTGLEVDNLTGDFTPKSNYKKFDTPKVYQGAIMNYRKYGQDRQFIVFCSNISHCIKTCLQFNEASISTKFVVSNLNRPNKPENEESGEYQRYLDNLESYELLQSNKHLLLKQTEVKSQLQSGSIRGVICIDILTIGFDYRPLSCLIMLRATQSLQLLIQIGGRIQRPYEGKTDGIFFDFGSNIQRLGELEQDREFSLWHLANDSIGLAPEKICEGVDKNGKLGCGRSVLASLSICKCGFRFSTKEELREVELIERLSEEPNKLKEMSVEGLKALAELKGYKKTWIWRQLWIRGESEFRNGMRSLGYDNKFIYKQQQLYSK